jgi:4'-phosphopantetheinyl transferase
LIYLVCSSGNHLNTLQEQREMSLYLLRLALFRSYGIVIDPSDIIRNRHGKPYLRDYPGIHFNISHCRGGVAVSVDACRTGIDIENIRDFQRSTAAKILSDDEYAALLASDDQDKLFFKFWTLKESYVKALGIGMGFPLNGICFSVGPDAQVSCSRKIGRFRLLDIESGFVTAICNLNMTIKLDLDQESVTCLRLP